MFHPQARPFRGNRKILVAAILAATGLATGPATGQTWDHAHGDPANTGFIDTRTVPATAPVRVVGGLGFSAPGSGPVIGPDGTVYVGNSLGELRAFRPNGDLKWQTRLAGRGIVASPAIGRDGAIYVVGVLTARDNRDGRQRLINQGELYRIDPNTGSLYWVAPFPGAGEAGTAATTASPTIWRSGNAQVVMVPVLHPQGSLRILAYSIGGQLLHEQIVTTRTVQPITSEGASLCDIFCVDNWFGLNRRRPRPDQPAAGDLPDKLEGPLPSLGVFTPGGAGAPVVVVADDDRHLVGYAFSPNDGFRETFRRHLANGTLKMSSPVLLRDGHSAVAAKAGDQAWLLFGGPNAANVPEIKVPLGAATPALTADGRLITVSRAGGSAEARPASPATPARAIQFGGESVAPAAASCSHVFVSTESALYTLDAASLQPVASHPWRGGGLSSPAIAANGAVYALAGATLSIFPAPPGPPPTTAFTCTRPGANPSPGGTTGGPGGGAGGGSVAPR
ncbi:MAG: PQQ-binding-like beta-propeller repeat protein [Reyranella sp.]|nr:PQQ-binding-like beta-propeller repeat protein [Reyranella sp.]